MMKAVDIMAGVRQKIREPRQGVTQEETATIGMFDKEQIRVNIRAGAVFDRAYVLMNILAAVIASYGLLANSPAVVIGAMIVAMLIGPITGISLGLVEGEYRLARSALLSLLAGMVLVYVTAFVVGLIHNDIPISSEIMARTAPNFLDLMVAIAGGAAGAYAAVSSRLSVSLVGVAVATALVPPLCASSILLGRGELDLAFGAFLLAFVNIVAIQTASAVVLWLVGFRGVTERGTSSLRQFLVRTSASLILLLVLAGLMVFNLHRSVEQQLFRSRTEEVLRQAVEEWPGAYLAGVRYDDADAGMIVRAVVRAPAAPTPEEVAQVEELIPRAPGAQDVNLRVRHVPVRVITPDGEIYAPEELTDFGGE
jgi:uncharacterized hydrophobic protein (TIGR00271 family)